MSLRDSPVIAPDQWESQGVGHDFGDHFVAHQSDCDPSTRLKRFPHRTCSAKLRAIIKD